MADKLSEGTVVLVIGMVIVFSILVLLWLVLLGFEKIFGNTSKKQKAPAKPKEAPVKTAVPAAPVEATASEDENELVAVITAAISAMTGMDGSKFKIKSIKRISNWNK